MVSILLPCYSIYIVDKCVSKDLLLEYIQYISYVYVQSVNVFIEHF